MVYRSFFTRVMVVVTIVFALLLLLSCLVPYISWEKLAAISFLSLVVPFLVGGNLLFFLYWLVKGNKYFLPPLLALSIGYFSLGTFYKLTGYEGEIPKGDLSIMSYNILGFDRYHARDDDAKNKIIDFISQQDPDILVFQEFDYKQAKLFTQYPHRFVNYIFRTESKVQQAIFSKYPIVAKGSLDFPKSSNHAIYVDVVYRKDTLRVYNVHLQSFRVIPYRDRLTKEPSSKLITRITQSFLKQREQAREVRNHLNASPYKSIVCGDFNSTQYSYAYRVIKGNMTDTFLEMGTGFGRTYNLRRIPYRIDYILADPSFKVTAHKNFDVNYSDHFPIMASFHQTIQ